MSNQREIFVKQMDYLYRAEEYAEARGDELWFKHYYTFFRQEYNIADSVWKTLSWLYTDNVANSLQGNV